MEAELDRLVKDMGYMRETCRSTLIEVDALAVESLASSDQVYSRRSMEKMREDIGWMLGFLESH